jgi:serine/threonine protein kinase
MANFQPQPNEKIRLNMNDYQFAPHPVFPNMAFGQEGRKAIVFQLRNNNTLWALKVFKPMYRDANLIKTCQSLDNLTQEGMEVCHRQCLTPSNLGSMASSHPEMVYAVLMPWMQGSTWFDVICGQVKLSLDACKHIAQNTVKVLASLESKGYAHCDVAAPNVVVNTGTGKVSFIDVEDMYGPDLPPPNAYPQGTDGYQHKSVIQRQQGQWCAEGDRFSAAVLLAEMLAWHSPEVRNQSDEEHYFATEDLQDPNCARYKAIMNVLSDISDQAAVIFEKAWGAPSLEACPTMEEWVKALDFRYVSKWIPIQPPKPAAKYQVDWEPIPTLENKADNYIKIISRMPIVLDSPRPIGPSAPPKEPGLFRPIIPNKLEWFPSKEAEGYIVEESEDENFMITREVYRGNKPYTNVTPSHGHINYYRVCAFNSIGNSPWSPLVSFKG